ncbi:erythromycin esterase family protein [Mycobacterium sp. 3519A]|jgi:erythromycin esterase|uniref:erythromycin esterase family protein n=1 Tax=Mycobacterium sp. 3519A TaxID=2057184 RepID=UPI00135C382E|nr:erythromycin esterase family protein [Mycobacterium sp. 3519A]
MDDIRQYTAPLRWHGGEPLVGPLMAMIGDVDVVGLGEPTHGDSQSLRLKRAIVREMSAMPGRMLVAWERGVGHIELVNRFLGERGGLPREEVRLVYPWVYEEVQDLFGWLGAVASERDVMLRGVDMDGPPPERVLGELRRRAGMPLSNALATVQELAAESKDHRVSAARWSAMAKTVSSVMLREQAISQADQLLFRTFQQWGQYERLKAISATDPTPWEYRDRCLAENLSAQQAITKPSRVAFWAHNGHVSKWSARAGGHLARAHNYGAIGVAFGAGSFHAWEPGDRAIHTRRLRPATAQLPPPNSIEALLQRAGVGDCFIDLRAMRNGENPLRQPLAIREVGLAADTSQFTTPKPITEIFDVLVWIREVTPAEIIRDRGATW